MAILQENRELRPRSIKEVLKRTTLHKTALGLAAIGVDTADVATQLSQHATVEERPSKQGDPALVAAAERRKARLRSLLDEM